MKSKALPLDKPTLESWDLTVQLSHFIKSETSGAIVKGSFVEFRIGKFSKRFCKKFYAKSPKNNDFE